MKSLAELRNKHVKPALQEFGFVKSRGEFRYEPHDGGLAIVDIRAWPLRPHLVTFFVELTVSPQVVVDWELRNEPPNERLTSKLHWGLWKKRLQIRAETLPEELQAVAPHAWDMDLWAFEKGNGAAAAEDLCSQLGGFMPEMLRMLDAAYLLEVFRACPPPKTSYFSLGGQWPEALLLADTPDSEELPEILRSIDIDRPDNPITDWVRQRRGI